MKKKGQTNREGQVVKGTQQRDTGRGTKDKVLSRYNAVKNDEVWTLDFTYIKAGKKGFWVFIAMDLATRKVITHNVKGVDHNEAKKRHFTAKDVINIIHEATLTIQKPKLVHSDQGGQFVAKEFSEYLEQGGIQQSIGDQVFKKFPNQAHESSNRTIKSLIRREIRKNAQLAQVPKTFKHLEQINEREALWIINNAVSNYNRQPHSNLFKASPNVAEVVLAKAEIDGVFNNDKITEPTELGLYNTNSKEHLEVKQKLAENFKKYAMEWLKEGNMTENKIQQIAGEFYREVDVLMITLQLQSLKNQQEAKLQAETVAQEAKWQIKQLQQTLDEQTNKLEVLVQAQRKKEEEERLSKERKLLRSNRKRLQARDAATAPELNTAWDVINQAKTFEYEKARDKVAMLMLYISGERIANLLLLTVNHLKQVADTNVQYFTLPRRKSKETTYRQITMSKHVKTYVERCETEIQKLVKGKQGDDHVFTPENSKKTLERAHFNKRINLILKKTGRILHKKLSSHSFRIGLTTSIIETSGINAAQAFIGHANIATTNVYNRSHFGQEKMQEVARRADLYRENRVAKKYKKRKDPENTQTEKKPF